MTIEELYVNYVEFLYLKNKITTIELIKYKFKNYILPFFGKYKPNEISEKLYIDFQINLLKFNYSNSFYQQIHGMMSNFFEFLQLDYNIDNIPKKIGYLSNNNYYSKQKKDIWSKKDFNKFIKKVDDKVYHALFNTLFYTGIRKGEALGLEVSDFNGNYININHTITKELFDGKRKILTPKTKKSIRKIRIDLITKIELKKLIKYYSKNFSDFNSDFFLFGGNKPISCTTLERKKNKYCKLANVKQIRIHDFRHSHATMLYRKKIDFKSIQTRLGHANISTTLDTYVHTNDKEEKRLINKINLTRI